ncbi:MAG: carotenoid oxygenase family protein [Chloroflexaceae bacterium]|jgi:all-trans-8'-apo-beta-carotenal 15,15'-oxygenase|nr:carotenoid oxygenase family protein [Chloroflexaceae bacterium]
MSLILETTDTAQLQRDWRRGYESQPEEHSYWIDEIEGQIPPDLHGTLFRNGPGLLDVNGQPIHHPFDGDGLVSSFAFANGRCHYRSRFVQTEGYRAERAAGKILYRGVFGTQRPGGWLANMLDLGLKNVANTNVIYWGGKLLALWEAAEPYRLDPATLETLGLDRLEGLLQPGDAFAAHVHVDPFCHWDGGASCLVNFAVKPGLNTRLNLFEFDQAGRLLRHQKFELGGFAFIHDMAITPNYAIFFQNPVGYNPLPYALGWRGAGQCLVSQPGKATRILVLPRHPSLGEARVFTTESGFVWHHANAFEVGDELVVDSIWYDSYIGIDPETDFRKIEFGGLPPGQLARTTINMRTGATERRFFDTRCCEFPVLHPAKVGRDYRYVYMAAADGPRGNAPLQAVWKFDLATGQQQVWSTAPRGFADEPIFVPRPRSAEVAGAVTPDVGDPQANARPDEDDGWLLTLVYDGARHRSQLVILDARGLERGPLAVLHLKQHLPHGLHGSFTSRYFGPDV